ncbi:NF-kappa-B inhibitor-like protein 1 [Nematostella vectensis]|uniref:NF-kappa-B inhibitor-like protein 1 n=1 Tax=Nematostella vectensis TaxID=45351 RepID=UPI00138FC6A9|nr:NF-kappa-B inhibitor-like protein 1 [Nematostella vectensis]
MPKSIQEKVFRYVREGRQKRLRSLLKKDKGKGIFLDEFLDKRKRTPLHVACYLGEDAIARVLLKSGASLWALDEDSNTPVHLALIYGLQVLDRGVLNSLILPLMRNGDIVDTANCHGETPTGLLARLKQEINYKEEDRRLYEEEEERRKEERSKDKEEEKRWKEKLFDEMVYDDVCCHHEAFIEDEHSSNNRQESYDEWAERILREKTAKYFANRAKTEDKNRQSDFQEREKIARERTRQLEQEHQEYIRKNSEKMSQARIACLKVEYERKCEAIFNQKSNNKLCFTDIPWPCEGTASEMLKMLTKFLYNEQDRKRRLREQQVRWHPDRFLQRCGERLDERDRDKVVEYVVEISQGINAMIESGK